ncbi:hypothetical protein HDU98_002065, partial [Podochytrium sp. JEL0797]
MSSPNPHPRTSIAPTKTLGSSSDPTAKSNSDRATSVSQSHVEMSADVKDNHDTFLTQRGGKIVQGTPLYVPLVSQNEQKQIRERVTKFEKFLKENDAKRQRANMKAMSERKLREQKEQENQQLQHLQLDLQSETANILRLI